MGNVERVSQFKSNYNSSTFERTENSSCENGGVRLTDDCTKPPYGFWLSFGFELRVFEA